MAYKNPEDKRIWRKQYNARNLEQRRVWSKARAERIKAGKPTPVRTATYDAKVYYRKNRERIREQIKCSTDEKLKRYRALIRERKAVPCADCGVQYPHYVMDFDHLPGTAKSFAISRLKASCSERTLLAEIAKCEVVCSNCHRERTFSRPRPHSGGAPKATDAISTAAQGTLFS